MNKNILWIVLAVAVLGFVIWLFATPYTPQNVGVPSTYNINITATGYDIDSLLVPLGSTVIWTNADTHTHGVTSNDGFFTTNKDLNPGQKFSYVFNKAGTFFYHDRLMPDHIGRIIVK